MRSFSVVQLFIYLDISICFKLFWYGPGFVGLIRFSFLIPHNVYPLRTKLKVACKLDLDNHRHRSRWFQKQESGFHSIRKFKS